MEVPQKNWHHDLPAMAAAITDKTRLLFVCNPNNPTGTMATKAEVAALMALVPEHVVVVFDEAYYEYVRHPEFPDSHGLREGRAQCHRAEDILENLRIGRPADRLWDHHAGDHQLPESNPSALQCEQHGTTRGLGGVG